jgi:hypothetical protein
MNQQRGMREGTSKEEPAKAPKTLAFDPGEGAQGFSPAKNPANTGALAPDLPPQQPYIALDNFANANGNEPAKRDERSDKRMDA